MGVKIAAVGWRAETFDPWKQAGHEVMEVPMGLGLADEELGDRVKDANIIVNGGRYYMSAKVMDQVPRLRAIVVPFIGVDKIDVQAATERGILVVNSPSEELVNSVAEATILLMLALIKRLHHDEKMLQEGKHGAPVHEDRNDMMMGRTVGIVGLGRIGRLVVRRLQGWDMRILAYDPYVEEAPEDLQGLVELVVLDTLLKESDFVSLHAVLTKETYHMIGARELRLMKPTAFVINTARGAIADEEAIADAVEQGIIRGAGLDAFETEPLPMTSRLRGLDPMRVVLTPHSLPLSREALDGNTRLYTHNVLELAAGRVPQQVVNRNVIAAWEKRFAAAVT